MGGLFSNTEHTHGPNAKITQNIQCFNCGKTFTKKNSYQEFYNHERICKESLTHQPNNNNSPNININDKETIKNIIKNNKKKNFFKENSNKNLELIENETLSNNQENIIVNNNNQKIQTDHSNYNTYKKKIITRLHTIKKHSQYLSSQNNRLSPLVSQNRESDNLFLNSEDNINSNLQYSMPLTKTKKLSLSKKNISDLNSNYLKDFPFEEKLSQFKKHMHELKIDWREGACTLHLDREDILQQSMHQFYLIDPYKELKINFKGEVSHDAGGLIREWFTVIFKELQTESLELFERSDTPDFSYKIHKNAQSTIQNLDIFNFIGKLLAKALLDNLTINACFNKLIFKTILDEGVLLDDLLYHSLKELKKHQKVDELGLYFAVQYDSKGEFLTDELIMNGNNVLVTNQNLDNYIERRITHLECKEKIFMNEIKTGLFSLIPEKLLKIFNSDELELLINGVPFIDVTDWKMNTIYKGYKEHSSVIVNFWNILHSKSQEELMRFLQFCTGSSRVPIGESNRGNISKFCITRTEFDKNSINFLKAHTCFNRIDLPDFPNISLMEEAINYIINNEILGFGID